MTRKEIYSTGEAAGLLNISRSTISRKFDQGVISGKRNPITGERFVSRESLVALMNQYNLPLETLSIEEKKSIFLGTSDDHLFSLLQTICSDDKRVEVKRWSHGGDLLVWCSRKHPDLLVIDEELPGIPAEEVIQSLRRQEEQKELKILCVAKRNNTNRCLEWGADEALTKEGLEREELRKRLCSFLELSEKQQEMAQPFDHQRRWPRVTLHLPARIEVYRRRMPYRRDPGRAVVENIGLGGAYLSEVKMEGGEIPCEPFRIFLEMNQEPLKNWCGHCKVVRLQSNGFLTAGVQFIELSKPNLGMIQALL